MANNRMFLIHKPTKLGILLGKRMGYGWYSAPKQDEINRFYEYLAYDLMEERQDDFVLAMEVCENSSCFSGWAYTEKTTNGFLLFDYT